MPEVVLDELPVLVPTLARLPVEEDLTAWPELGLEVLATEEMEDLAAPEIPDDLVAVEVLVVAAPVLERVMEELLAPAVLDTDPMPLLVADPVVATLGL